VCDLKRRASCSVTIVRSSPCLLPHSRRFRLSSLCLCVNQPCMQKCQQSELHNSESMTTGWAQGAEKQGKKGRIDTSPHARTHAHSRTPTPVRVFYADTVKFSTKQNSDANCSACARRAAATLVEASGRMTHIQCAVWRWTYR
jgi:hypothetical protein